MKFIICILGLLGGAASSTAWAQLSLTTFNSPVTVTFDVGLSGVSNGQFSGAGFQSSPASGQLDSDAWSVTGWSDGALAFGGSRTTAGDYARGTVTTAQTTGGIYSFGGTNRQLMIQPGGSDWAPGTITLRIQNNTGVSLDEISFSFDRYVRNDQGRGNSFNFSYSIDDVSYVTTGLPVSASYTSTAAADLTPSWALQATVSGSISFTSPVVNGGYVYFRWSGADAGGSGSRDEFGLDNIAISAVPEPSAFSVVLGCFAAGGAMFRRRRR